MSGSVVHVILACDRAFRMQVAVTAQSICRHFGFARGGLVLHVFAQGWDEADRRGFERGLSAFPARVRWHEPEIRLLKGARTHGHVSLATYFRILAFEQLSRDLPQAIYLDCDLVVRADLRDLWDMPLPEGKVLMAAQDVSCPRFRTTAVKARSKLTGECVFEGSGIPVGRLGIPGDAPYFNAGVLVVNLAAWGAENFGARALAFMAEESEHLLYWDQDVLNALLWNRWAALPPRWNTMPALAREDRTHWLYPDDLVDAALAEPAILHYATHRKPWEAGYDGPWGQAWRDALAWTVWKDWRPRRWRDLARCPAKFCKKMAAAWRWHVRGTP